MTCCIRQFHNRSPRRGIVVVALLGAVLSPGWPAAAQTPPPSVAPGQIERQFQPPPQPAAPGQIEIPQPQAPAAPQQVPTVRLELRDVEISGATVFAPEELRPLYADLLGKPVRLEQVYLLAEQITARYRRAGYILSQAVVPPQQVEGGVVKIRVVEGYIAAVRLEGDPNGARGFLEAYGRNIVADRPTRLPTLERYLLLMNDLPGVTAHSRLEPDPSQFGAADLVIVTTHKPISAFAGVDNRGTKFIGPYEVQAGASLNSLIGLGERIDLRYIGATNPHELAYGEARYVQPLGGDGLRLELFGGISSSRPGSTLKPLDLSSEYKTLGLSSYYPLIRSRGQNLTLGGGFTIQDSFTDAQDVRSLDDRLRYFTVSAQYDVTDRWGGSNLAFGEIRQGINGLGSSRADDPLLSRALGQPDFTLVHSTLQRSQDLGFVLPKLSLLTAVDGQYAFSRLLIAQQYAYGGEQYGRAYDPAEITGDHGFAAKAELQYLIQGVPPVINAFQPYGFYDFGYVSRISPTAGAQTATGASAGLGVRFFADHFTGYVELSKPLTRGISANDNSKGERFFFRVLASY
jgi:hemolysin activation/secretion protein